MNKSILKTYNEVKTWFDKANLSVLACDTELVDMNWLTMQIAGISFCDGEQACYIDWILFHPCEEIRLVYFLQDIIENTNLIIMHNAPFDLMVIQKMLSVEGHLCEPKNIFCTMVAAHLIDENQPKALKVLARQYLGVHHTKIVEFKEAISEGFHSDKFYKYGLSDVVWTYQLYEIFKEELERQKLEDLFYNIEMPFQWCLRDLVINGIKADKEKLLELQGQLKEEVKRLQLAMYDAGDIEYYFQGSLFGDEPELVPALNINSTKQLVKFIRKDLGIKLTEKTKPSKLHPTGQYSTKNAVLESIKHRHKFIELLLEYRSAFKLLNSFLIPLPNFIQEDGRIRANFHNTVAVTGRLSSSKPNLQQLPKKGTCPVPIRECFVAPPGKALLCADYAGQELRVLAHVSQDPTMIKAFMNNEDLHQAVADEFGVTRDKAKTINFGICYGKTYIGFAKDWNISEAEAKKFIDNYFKRFPAIKKSVDKCSRKTEQQKGIRNLTGRVRRFEYVDNRAKRQSYNFLIQGASADIGKKAAHEVRALCLQHPEWEAFLVLVVHDEFIWEIKEEYVEQAAKEITEIIENSTKLCIPLVIDIDWGVNYQDAKP